MGEDKARFEECGVRCRETAGCSHFAWRDGWCYKKSGIVRKQDAFQMNGVNCGILPAKVFIARIKEIGKTITSRIQLARDVY